MAKNANKTRAPKPVENSEGDPATAAKPNPAALADAAGASSGVGEGPSAPDAPSGGTVEPAGTLSTNAPRSEAQGGAIEPTGSARHPDISVPTLDELVEAGPIALDALDRQLAAEQEKFRKAYPHLAAAIDAWQAVGKAVQPKAVRITAKRDGFRRAGKTHSSTPAEHPIETFRLPEQLEQLLAEPNLVVELI